MRTRRLVLAFILAVTVAVSLTMSTSWSPLCPLFERYSVEWYFLGCWYGEPDPPHPPEG